MNAYDIKYENGVIVVRIPYDGKKETKDKLEESSTGNTNIIASTRGGVLPPELVAIGDPDLKLNFSLYTKNDALKEAKRRK